MSAADRFAELLSDEGFRPRLEGEADDRYLAFRAEGRSFVLLPDERDPGYVHIVCSFPLDAPGDMGELLWRANVSNARWKIVKTVVSPSGRVSVDFHFESFLVSDQGAGALLSRGIDAVLAAARGFFSPAQQGKGSAAQEEEEEASPESGKREK